MIKLLAIALLATSAAFAGAPEEEAILNGYREALRAKAPPRLIPGLLGADRSRLALDAIERTLDDGKHLDLPSIIPAFAWPQLPPRERARWFRLGAIQEAELVANLQDAPAEPGLLFELLALGSRLQSAPARALLGRLEKELPAEAAAWRSARAPWVAPSAAAVRALFSELPDVAHYQNGAYAGKPRLFLFCRHDRMYPCLLAMRDKDDQPVRGAAGKLWTQPGLALSGYQKPFNQSGGHTPQGVHLMDGVMPEANDTYSYGRFRRVVLSFPPKSSGETEMKRLLPAAAIATDWWKESQIARDVGRAELRIHGTGQRNEQPDLVFYPFISTVGCVAQREMKYGSVDYVDQRQILDQLMKAQGLEPKFANETAIKGLLYVIDIDEQKKPVTAADLAKYEIQ